ncbi:STAS domain-containing protein [Streptomyces sp. ISL-22]|uniref:STAS domain-containing protein n=1 Tax=Streptomyces sp. ISL-22 TaxID=2819180 RepID=UPI0035ABF459
MWRWRARRTTSPPAGCNELEAAMTSGARCVQADFSRVAFCDCSGLNALSAARSRCRAAGVRFCVSGPLMPEVRRLLHLTDTGPILLAEAVLSPCEAVAADPVDGSAPPV